MSLKIIDTLGKYLKVWVGVKFNCVKSKNKYTFVNICGDKKHIQNRPHKNLIHIKICKVEKKCEPFL